MSKKMLLVAVCLLALTGGLALIKFSHFKKMGAADAGIPPLTVTAAPVKADTW
jgi:hypothetical protein